MEEMTSSSWKRKGSSIVWSPELLGPLILAAEATPLREVLAWRDGKFPALPPAGGKTVLVGGLQTVLDSMPDARLLTDGCELISCHFVVKLADTGRLCPLFLLWTDRASCSTTMTQTIWSTTDVVPTNQR